MNPFAERIAIEYHHSALHGYLFRAANDSAARPISIITVGGNLASRAASGEPRLAACIADPGELSLFEEFKSRMPGFIARAFSNGNPLVLALLDVILRRRMRHTTAGWGMRRRLWTHCVKNPLDYS